MVGAFGTVGWHAQHGMNGGALIGQLQAMLSRGWESSVNRIGQINSWQKSSKQWSKAPVALRRKQSTKRCRTRFNLQLFLWYVVTIIDGKVWRIQHVYSIQQSILAFYALQSNSHRTKNRFPQRLRISLATNSTVASGSPCTTGFATLRLILLMLFMERKVQLWLAPGLDCMTQSMISTS